MKVLHSICQQIWKTQQWSQDWKRSVFIPIPKKGNAKECSNYYTIALISHASKVILKIIQARLQQYVNCELPNVQTGFRKGRWTTDQIANILWSQKKRIQEHLFRTMLKPLTAEITINWKFFKRWEYLTCLLRNLYAGQKATVRIGHGTTATAAAKSLQSCPTLYDPIDGSSPGPVVPGIPQARTLEWVAISFSNAWKWKVKGKSPSRVRLFATPWTAAYQAPPSMGFSRQEYWSGVPLAYIQSKKNFKWTLRKNFRLFYR